MKNLKLESESISDLILASDIEEEDDYRTPIDNEIIKIISEYKKEGEIIIINVEKHSFTEVSVSIDNDLIKIIGHFNIPDAFSNKDDSVGGKIINNLLDLNMFDSYQATVFPRQQYDLNMVTILVFPTTYLS